MHKTIFILLLLFIQMSVFSQSRMNTGKIQITISNIRNNKGRVLCSLFKEGVGYPDQPANAYYKASLIIKEGRANLLIDSLPPGRYAMALLHDENGDNKMNTTMFGLPKEGYGFSNNVMGLMGPPAFSKASFSVVAGQLKGVAISMRY